MYMFTQCSRQLGCFPPLLGSGHKSRGNIHWFLRECTFPLMQSSFCRKQGFLPSLYLGVQGPLHKRDESHFYNARLVSAQIPAGLNDSLAGARHCLYQFQWLSQRPGRLYEPAPCSLPFWETKLRSASTKAEARGQQACPLDGVPSRGVAQRPCQGQPGCWVEAWHNQGNERSLGLGVGGYWVREGRTPEGGH